MPRKSRVLSATGVYHVMLRGIDRRDIFRDDQDRGKFMKVLRAVVNPKDRDDKPLPPYVKVYAYCLMDNHVHLLLGEGSETIGEVMKRISVSFVSYFNKRYERLGPLFQGRFKSEPVEDAGYFIRLLRYIHQNPVAAEMVAHPRDFEWSSWHEYAGTLHRPAVCERAFPFSAMLWNEVRELALNISNGPDLKRQPAKHIADSEARKIVSEKCGNRELRDFTREERIAITASVIAAGVGIRQLARIVALDYKTIQRLVNAHKDA